MHASVEKEGSHIGFRTHWILELWTHKIRLLSYNRTHQKISPPLWGSYQLEESSQWLIHLWVWVIWVICANPYAKQVGTKHPLSPKSNSLSCRDLSISYKKQTLMHLFLNWSWRQRWPQSKPIFSSTSPLAFLPVLNVKLVCVALTNSGATFHAQSRLLDIFSVFLGERRCCLTSGEDSGVRQFGCITAARTSVTVSLRCLRSSPCLFVSHPERSCVHSCPLPQRLL